MSKLLSLNKRHKKVIASFSKDNDFYPRFTKVLKNLGFENQQLPVDFPDNISEKEEWPNLEKINDFCTEDRHKEFDLTLVYGQNKIFAIVTGEPTAVVDFNNKLNDEFEF
ncbi:MAG: hypothetical protein U9R08_01650 [Nanoarchaeota archaeon]|nr:hypothetical protein [Nanoarchaeota archaeon]